MDIDNQPIRIRVNNFNYEHFKSIGYDVPLNTYIDIKAKELPYGAGTKIKVQCDYCGKIFEKSYRRYLETKDDICCYDCKTYKMIKSSLRKYGNKCSLRNPEIERKMIENNNKKFGCDFPLQNKEIWEKTHSSYLQNHSGDEVLTSKNQSIIAKLYDAKLNVPIGIYFADMLLNDNIIIEYDGTGHDLNVRLGGISQEELVQKENKRNKYMLSMGYKVARIVHNKEILPNRDVLLKLKDKILYDLSEKHFVIYDLCEFESQID